MDHIDQPIHKTPLKELAASGKRVFLYIDGCAVIAPGDSRAGKSDLLYHACVLTNDDSDLPVNRRIIQRVFVDGCIHA